MYYYIKKNKKKKKICNKSFTNDTMIYNYMAAIQICKNNKKNTLISKVLAYFKKNKKKAFVQLNRIKN